VPKVQLIFSEMPGEIPASYQLPAGLDLVLSSVVARFNGAAAAATFIPVLEVLSQDGRLIARVRPDQEFAVGDTGVVTYAPFLRRQANGGAGGAGGEYAYFTRTVNRTLTSGSAPNPFFDNSTNFSSDSTVITANTDAIFGGTFELLATGVYVAVTAGLFTTTFAASKVAEITWAVGSGAGVDDPQREFHEDPRSESYIGVTSMRVLTNRNTVGSPPGQNYVQATFQQISGVDRVLDHCAFAIQRIRAF